MISSKTLAIELLRSLLKIVFSYIKIVLTVIPYKDAVISVAK